MEECNMIQAVLFDVDDTLYDQQEPFQQAVQQLFPELFEQIEPIELYRSFRFHSDDIFAQYTSGKWSLEYMRFERFLRTFSPFVAELSQNDAKQFQNLYEQALQKIQLQPNMKEVLKWISGQPIKTGVITNGPGAHQQKKIDQLQLTKWIPHEHLFISGNVGEEKPHKKIFEFAAAKIGLDDPSNILYIGDSFENDIVGSHRANWKNIWFNHRQRLKPDNEKMIEPNFTITQFSEVLPTLQKMIKS